MFISSLPYINEDADNGTPSTIKLHRQEDIDVHENEIDFLTLDSTTYGKALTDICELHNHNDNVNNFQQPIEVLCDQLIFEDLDDDVVFQPAFSIINQKNHSIILDTNFTSLTNQSTFQATADEVGDATIAIDILASLGIIKDQEGGKFKDNLKLWNNIDVDSHILVSKYNYKI